MKPPEESRKETLQSAAKRCRCDDCSFAWGVWQGGIHEAWLAVEEPRYKMPGLVYSRNDKYRKRYIKFGHKFGHKDKGKGGYIRWSGTPKTSAALLAKFRGRWG